MEEDWRTIQLFLGKELNKKDAIDVYEVSIHSDGPDNIRCTCYGFSRLHNCVHINFVENKMNINNGSFGLVIPQNVPDEIAYEAFLDAESSRQFILNYGKIEVI